MRSSLLHVTRMLRQDFDRWIFNLVVNGLLGNWIVPRIARAAGYRALGMEVPIRLNVWPGVRFATTKVTLGHDVMVNSGTTFYNREHVTLGDNVVVGFDVAFLTESHEIGTHERRAGARTIGPITVGAGAWIGARVMVMPGLTIGPGAVIAAGAMVTKDCDADTVYAGVPAKRVKSLSTPAQPTGNAVR